MKKRIAMWDNLKFILITLVVIGHFIDGATTTRTCKSLFLFIYSFHMPLFIFISGLFHKNENLKKKIGLYIILGILLKALNFISLYLSSVSFSLLSDADIPWYMFAMAAFIVITYFIKDYNFKIIFPLSILLALLVGYDKTIGDFLYLSRIIVFFPFYYLGTHINKDKLVNISDNRALKCCSFIIFISWALLCYFKINSIYFLRPLFTGRNAYGVSMGDIGFVYRLITYFISSLISFCLIVLIPKSRIPYFTKIGENSLQIYFFHQPIINLLVVFGIMSQLMTSATGKLTLIILAILTTLILNLNIFKIPIKYIQDNLIKNKN